jgi:hypothetical protein
MKDNRILLTHVPGLGPDEGALLRIDWRGNACRAARTRENCTSEFGNVLQISKVGFKIFEIFTCKKHFIPIARVRT